MAVMVVLFLVCLAVTAAHRKDTKESPVLSGQPVEHQAILMGTVVTEKLYGGDSQVISGIENAISHLEQTISWRLADSVIAGINASGSAVLTEDMYLWMTEALALAENTSGAFDPTLRPLIALWGIEEASPTVPGDKSIKESLSLVGYEKLSFEDRKLTLQEGMCLDFGAIGKGIALDVIADYLEESGVSAATIAVGGSVLTYGDKPGGDWQIAVRDPDGPDGSALGILSISGTHYISTSGDYEKYFEENGVKYHHIFDPGTGYPAKSGLRSVTVVCDSGLKSDGLSTACFVLGYEASLPVLQEYGAQAVFILEDGSVRTTEGLEAYFSIIK